MIVTTYTKPAVRNAWGQTATAADLQDPGNTYASAGWQIGVKPPRQYFNWVLNWSSAAIRYFCQNGIPGWDANETYANLSYVLSPNGYLCRATTNTTNQNPDTNFNPSGPWDSPNVLSPPFPDNSSRVPNTSWIWTHFLQTTTTLPSIGGQVTNAQVPVGAITQWQGSLSISGGQVSSAVARANTVYNTTGQYATFNWAGQSGQPSWLWGSNDGLNYYVWNPANFSVSNASTVAGLSVTTAAAGSTVMARDSSGYAWAVYFNQASPNNENPSVSQFVVTNGSDNYFRKANATAVQAALGYLTTGNFAFSAAGYQRIANGAIIQAGRVGVNTSATNISFPLAFPNGCFAVSFTPEGTNNQPFLTSPPQASFFTAAGGPAEINYIALGW